MVLLRKAGEEGPLPRLWFLHHENVATIERGVFKVHEPAHEAGTSRASLCLVSGRFRGGRPRTCASAPPSWPRSSAEGHMPACPATTSALHSNAMDLAQSTERPMARALAMGGRSPCVVNPRA